MSNKMDEASFQKKFKIYLQEFSHKYENRKQPSKCVLQKGGVRYFEFGTKKKHSFKGISKRF